MKLTRLVYILFLCGPLAGSAQEPAPKIDPANIPAADFAAFHALLTNEAPITWVFTGDSITHGASHTHGEHSYPEDFEQRIRCELNRRRDYVINTGISGDTSVFLLKDFDHRVADLRPMVVSLMIGANDCGRWGVTNRVPFESHIRELVHRIRGIGAIPVLQTMNRIDAIHGTRWPDLPRYEEIMIKVAREENVMLVDNWTYWQDQCPNLPSLAKWLDTPDTVHPNARGHREMARLTFATLGIYDPKSPTCQSVDPTRASDSK